MAKTLKQMIPWDDANAKSKANAVPNRQQQWLEVVFDVQVKLPAPKKANTLAWVTPNKVTQDNSSPNPSAWSTQSSWASINNHISERMIQETESSLTDSNLEDKISTILARWKKTLS